MAEVYQMKLQQVIIPAPPGLMVWLPGETEDDAPECFPVLALGFEAQSVGCDQEAAIQRTRWGHAEHLELPEVVIDETEGAWEWQSPHVCVSADWDQPWAALGTEVFVTEQAARQETKDRIARKVKAEHVGIEK